MVNDNSQAKEVLILEQQKILNENELKTYIETIGKTGSILGLDSITALMHELSDVQDQLSVIHVAGTNGKGSVCAMLDSV